MRNSIPLRLSLVGGYWLGLAVSIAFVTLPVRVVAQTDFLLRPYPYLVVEQDLRTVLREFARNQEIGLDLSPQVKGQVRAVRDVDTADAFLHRIAEAHNLVWYLDQQRLFVSTQEESRTERMAAPTLAVQKIRTLADQWPRQSYGVGIAFDEHTSTLMVTGPASFRNRVAELVGSVRTSLPPEQRVLSRKGDVEIVVYRGNAGSQRVVVPQ